jgi:hypothetical protein
MVPSLMHSFVDSPLPLSLQSVPDMKLETLLAVNWPRMLRSLEIRPYDLSFAITIPISVIKEDRKAILDIVH